MKIIEIERTVSDGNYNNMSAKAILDGEDDPIASAVILDSQIKTMMAAIEDKMQCINDFRREKQKAVDILKAALEHASNYDIPF